MFTIDVLRELFRHMGWADRRIWDTALATPAAAADTVLRDRLLHIHVVQRAFLSVWTGQPVVFPVEGEFAEIAAVERWGRSYYGDARAFLDTVDTSRLSEPVAMPWVKEFERQLGREFATPTLGETMFQVTSHTTHHRGQVSVRLRELGAEPPLVDYIAWVWFGRPAAD